MAKTNQLKPFRSRKRQSIIVAKMFRQVSLWAQSKYTISGVLTGVANGQIELGATVHLTGTSIVNKKSYTYINPIRKFNPINFNFILFCFFLSCQQEPVVLPAEYNQSRANSSSTSKVVIVVIDGPRFTETWGDYSKKHIPYFVNHLAPKGVVYNNFYNDGITNTVPGHAAITTGFYQNLDNSGGQFPEQPSMFQAYLNHTRFAPNKAFVITGKTKLNILADCMDIGWRGKFNPSFDASERTDLATYLKAIEIFKVNKPHLTLVHFKGPDQWGHRGDWMAYIESIQETDSLANNLWNFLQQDPEYKDNTTLFLTNDHGRHSDNVATGFIGHGDDCSGCRHINFLAIGPDIKQGQIINQRRGQKDIAATVAEVMGFTMPSASGEVMREIFKDSKN